MMIKSDKYISFSIIFSFLLSVFLCVFFLDDAASYLKDAKYVEVGNANEGDVIGSPLLNQYKKISAQYQVNFDIANDVLVKSGKGRSFYDFPLFLEKEKSLDVLFIGDSSLAWGFRPDIFETATGLQTGVFTYEAQLLNKANVALYKALAECFLKPSGKLVLSFALGTQTADPDITNLPHLKVYEDDIVAANEAIKQDKFCQEFRDGATLAEGQSKTQDSQSIPFSIKTLLSFERYQNLLDEWRALLKSRGMKLPKISFYQDKMLAYINPDWEAELNQGQQNKILRLRENPDTITLFYPEVEVYAPTQKISKQVDLSLFKPDDNLTDNAHAVIEGLSGVRDVVYLIPLSTSSDGRPPRNRSFYQYFYKDEFGLIDMFYHFEIHKLPPIPMQFGHHPLNEGGVIQTLEIAKAINELKPQWNKSASDFRNVILEEQ